MFRASLLALLSLPMAACLAQAPVKNAPPTPTTPAVGSTPSGVSVTPVPLEVPGAPIAIASPAPAVAQPKITYTQCRVEGQFVAITFDDGPSAENTPRLLDMLKKRGVKATFFVVGQCAAEYPDIMKRIVGEGHEIASHSWSHPSLSQMGEGGVTDQLQRTHDIIFQTTGVAPKTMRPPYGNLTNNQRAWVNKKWGYKVILWDVDPLDWKYRNSAHVEAEILKHTVPGSIILAHDIHKSTVDAMPSTLDALLGKGFKFVTVSELISMDRPAPPKVKATPAPVHATPESEPEPAKPASSPAPLPRAAVKPL